MTLKEFAINIPAIRDEAKALWPSEPSYYLECVDCENTYNYWEDNEHGDDMPSLKYCNQCGGQLEKTVQFYRDVHLNKLKQMLFSDNPLDFLKEESK